MPSYGGVTYGWIDWSRKVEARPKRNAIIVDLDGTLCDSSKRVKFITGKKKDFPAFYAAAAFDEPHNWCRWIIDQVCDKTRVIFVTGRPLEYKSATQKWLRENTKLLSEYGYEIFMREDGNTEPDADLKRRLYYDYIEPNFNVIFCLEDRKRVADMWRSLGLVCLHCAEGNF